MYYSQASKYEPKIEKSESKKDKVQYLKMHYQEKVNAFYMFEVLFYSSATTYLSIFFNKLDYNLALIFIFIFPFFIVGFIFRYFIYSIGIRLSNNLITSFIPLLFIIAKINTPLMEVLHFINKKIGGRGEEENVREELNAILENAHEDGSLESSEYQILSNMMKFHDVHVADIMTPRTVIYSLNANKTVEEVLNSNGLKMYSRIPIWEGDSLDKGLIGYVLTKDILQAALNGKKDKKLREFQRQIYFVPENIELDSALEQFLKNKQQFMMVIDEYGGIDGLLSMEDVMETILGVEIIDEMDKFEDLRTFAIKNRDKRIANSQKNLDI